MINLFVNGQAPSKSPYTCKDKVGFKSFMILLKRFWAILQSYLQFILSAKTIGSVCPRPHQLDIPCHNRRWSHEAW